MLRSKRVPFNANPNAVAPVRPNADVLQQERSFRRHNPPGTEPVVLATAAPTSAAIPPKRVAAQYNRKPAAVGVGGDLLRGNVTRCREVIGVAKQLAPDLPMVSAALVAAATDLSDLARMQLVVMTDFQSQLGAIEAQNRSIAFAAATEAVQKAQPFARAEDMKTEVNTRADRLVAVAQQQALSVITDSRASDATDLINKTKDDLLASQTEIERATFKSILSVTATGDADFQRGAEAMKNAFLSQKYFDQSPWAFNTLSSAIRLGETEIARQLKYAVLPIMTQRVAEGVTARRTAVAMAAGRAGAATDDLLFATRFVNLCDKVDPPQRDVLAIAREAQAQLVAVFMRSAGKDPADPNSTSAQEFSNMMYSRKPMQLDEPLPIDSGDDGLRWLTRGVRATGLRPLPAWTDNVEITTAGKAVTK